MTSLAIAKLASDALLFASLLFLSFKFLKRQPGSNTNFAKLKELELSLKEVVKQADEASQNFNDELLTRRKDLEKVLTDATSIEAKLSKTDTSLDEAIREAVLAKKDLESAVEKSISEFNQLRNSLNKESERERARFSEKQAESRNQQYTEEEFSPKYFSESAEVQSREESAQRVRHQSTLSHGREIISASQTSNFEYSKMLEPPSFSQIAEVTEKRVAPRVDQASILSQMIEKSIEPNTLRAKAPDRSARPIQDSLRSVAESAERSIEATRLPDHLEEALTTSEQASSRLANDPRLGVLGGLRRTTQVI